MKNSAVPVHTDIVLVGGGHSHAAVLKRFGMRPTPGVQLTLVTSDVMAPYSGMLPGLIAGHYSHAQSHIDLRRLCRFAGARLYHTAAEAIDLTAMRVGCADRPAVGFDWLSLDIGSTPALDAIPGAAEHAIAVKPVGRFIERWARVEARIVERGGEAEIVTVGAGAGGVELTLSLQVHVAKVLESRGIVARPRFHIVCDGERIVPTHAEGVRRRLARALHERAIEVHLGRRAAAIEPAAGGCTGERYRVSLEGGRRIEADAVLALTHAGAAPWLADTGLALDEHGFVRVGATLQSVSHERVFAAGDIAAFEPRPLAKSGVFAVRQGPVLARNLQRAARAGARGRPMALRPYRPQARTLALISTGDRNAVASYGALSIEGPWVWRAKDRIDRRWMRKYLELPQMDDDRPPAGVRGPEAELVSEFAMRCGGCGSKVSSPILRRVLADLEPGPHPGVLVGLAQGDDAAVLELPPDRLLVQSVDHFRSFIDDPYAFARITTHHCLSDLFAMGAEPHSAQAMVTLPFAAPEKVEDDLRAVLTGIAGVLAEAGAALIGGHTAEGPELGIGLCVNGLAAPGTILTKGGAAPSQDLILTKPLGTGVIFAADMRAQASAAAVAGALEQMQHSNQAAARCLREHGARACTDVTGFGLAGHLIEMLRAAALEATIDAGALPLLPGAAELFAAGTRSSLHAGNSAFLEQVDQGPAGEVELAALADPQTSGGLLAALDPERSSACVQALHALGYVHARIVGHTAAAPSPALAGHIRLR